MTSAKSRPVKPGDEWADASESADVTEDLLQDLERATRSEDKAREIEKVARDLVRERVPVHEVVKQALHEHPRCITQSANRTLGEKAADVITRWLGSWTFIIVQSVILVIWITLNLTELLTHAWDPYPFILLNLALSFQAAYAAPIIMMSQNRQAEIEAKIAHNAYDQVAEIDNMQKVQMEILEAIHEFQKSMASQAGMSGARSNPDEEQTATP